MMYFYSEEFLAPRPTRTLEDHPLLAVRDCLFNIFAASPFSIRNLRTRRAVVTAGQLITMSILFFICPYIHVF
jgi:hypothetical protein